MTYEYPEEGYGYFSAALMSADGDELLPPCGVHYESFTHQTDCDYMVLIDPDGTLAAWDAQGRRVMENRWNEMIYVGGGLFCVENEEYEEAVVDVQGRLVVPYGYDDLDGRGGFIIGMREYDEMVDVINREGRVVLELPEDDYDLSVAATPDYFAWVQDGLLTIIDQQGDVVW